MKKYHGVIFDLDGTLLDSAPDIHHALNLFLGENNIEAIDLPTTTSFIGNGVRMLLERALDYRHSSLDIDVQVERFLQIYNSDPTSRTVVFEGVKNCLNLLKQNGKLVGLCTNKPYKSAMMILDGKGLNSYFDTVLGGDSLSVMKPDPAPLWAAIKALNLDNIDVLYVGDSLIDAQTASSAGVDFGYYKGGYDANTKHEFENVIEFTRYDELTNFLVHT